MSEPERWQKRIDDVLARIAAIERALHGKSLDDLDQDEVVIAALERYLSIIGEAVNFIPKDIQAEYTDIPWHKITGMRNILVHGYDVIAPTTLWGTAVKDLGHLKVVMLAMKEKYGR